MTYTEIINLMCRRVKIYHKYLTEQQLDTMSLSMIFAMCHPEDREEIDRLLSKLR